DAVLVAALPPLLLLVTKRVVLWEVRNGLLVLDVDADRRHRRANEDHAAADVLDGTLGEQVAEIVRFPTEPFPRRRGEVPKRPHEGFVVDLAQQTGAQAEARFGRHLPR